MHQPDNVVIQTNDLSKSYDRVEALKSLNLTVPRHSIFGFLGPNGAGKSTTMKLLLGLIRPTAGTGTVFGHDIVRDSMAVRARTGYLAQQPHFYEEMTARETLHFTAEFFFKGPRTAIEARVREMLHLAGLEVKADRPVKGFSGGERQRLGIAQAQINYPDLLILDEPAAALDPIGRRDVLQIMERLRQYSTIFYSTHILDDVQQVSDMVAILNHGELVTQGPIDLLLHGDGSVIYTVSLKGDVEGAYRRLVDQSWVGQIEVGQHNGLATWQVGVTDEAAAEAKLLRLLLAGEETIVTAFSRKKVELEEVFMELVEGENHGRE